jgi:tagatose-6-phosphate ketose/aldose isomerase
MNSLQSLLSLPENERQSRGVVYTPREIAQQPETWRATYELFRQQHSAIQRFLRSAGVGWDSARRPTVFLIGAGTSDYVGRSLAQLLRRCWQCEVLVIPSTDLLTHAEEFLLPGRPYLWISFSRSGQSPEGIAVLQQAFRNHPDIHHLIVSCNAQSKMLGMAAGHRQVFGVALPEEVHDHGLAMTSSFSNMVVFGQCLAHIETPEQYDKLLHELAEEGIPFRDAAAALAADLANENFTKACFVGSGPLKAVATESALKLLEMTAGKIQTMSESALGLRHGPMAALDENTLFVAFLSGDEKILTYELDLLEEIGKKRLVKTRAAVSAHPHSQLDGLAENVLGHASAHPIADDYRPPLDVMLGQLLGLFFSLRCGLKPDHPSPNGAISRVVQNVLIHS